MDEFVLNVYWFQQFCRIENAEKIDIEKAIISSF